MFSTAYSHGKKNMFETSGDFIKIFPLNKQKLTFWFCKEFKSCISCLNKKI